MEEKKTVLTYEGLKKLEEELQDLKVNRRRENAAKLAEAREQGDLSENAEYDAAKEEQRDIQTRIEEIESLLKNVEVIDEDEIDINTVSIGCRVKVKIKDRSGSEEVEYKIVGSSEARSLENRISNESPVGAALLGHKKGDKIKLDLGGESVEYKIMEINRSK